VSAAGDVISAYITEYPDINYKSQCVSSHGINYDENNTGQRLLQLKRYHYPLYYTVVRSKTACVAWDFISSCMNQIKGLHKSECRHFLEVLTYISVLIQGKHANLKMFFWLRDDYVRSSSGKIEHFDYDIVGKCDVDLYETIFELAEKKFQEPTRSIVSYLDDALRIISTHQTAKNSSTSKELFQRQDGNDLRAFVELDLIIQKHRDNILQNIDGTLPIYTDKYAPNWEHEMKKILKEKLVNVHQPMMPCQKDDLLKKL
jgi:hypothetical protein